MYQQIRIGTTQGVAAEKLTFFSGLRPACAFGTVSGAFLRAA